VTVLARSHVKAGAAGGIVAASAGLMPFTEPRIAAVAGGLYLAGTLLPDLDSKRATAPRAWGLLSRAVSLWVRLTCLAVHRLSRGPNDAVSRTAHRTATHTAIGCAAAGGAVAAAVSQLPHWAAAMVVALVCGIAGATWGRGWKWVVAGVAGVVAYSEASLTVAWPVWWAAVSLGCVAHCAGDGCSKNGVPFWWPLARDGRRWAPVHVLPEPLRFVTGGWGERVALGVIYAVTAGAVWPAIAPAPVAVG
jgi:hypothetical protein